MGESRRVKLTVETGLTGEGSMAFLDHVRALPFASIDLLVISLKLVDEVDVSGVAVLVRVYSHLMRLGKRLAIVNASQSVRARLLEVGLGGVIDIAERRLPTESSATPPVSSSDLIPGQ